MYNHIQELLGDKAEYLLGFNQPKIKKEQITLPQPEFVNNVFGISDRNNRVLNNLDWMYNTGRLSNTGYLSILPVDQGIEHSAGASFAKNPIYFDPENIINSYRGRMQCRSFYLRCAWLNCTQIRSQNPIYRENQS